VTPTKLLIRRIFLVFAIMDMRTKARIQNAPREQVS